MSIILPGTQAFCSLLPFMTKDNQPGSDHPHPSVSQVGLLRASITSCCPRAAH